MRNRGTLSLVLAVGVLCLIAGIAFSNSNVIKGASNQEAYRQEVQNCLAQLGLPTSNNLAAINTANENLFAFIYNRSGVQVTQAGKHLIKDTEERAWSQARRITPTQLSQILSDAAIEILSNSTGAEVNQAAETLRGFTASDLPTGFVQGRNKVKLRGNGEGTMATSSFISDVNSIRNSDVANNKLLISTVKNRTTLEVERRVKLLADASPEAYGSILQSVTPMQAILIAYSIAADDPLTYNQTGLEQRMQTVRQGISQATGQTFSNPQGHRAFGTNGYLYSSPVDLLLNENTLNRILNSCKNRSGIE